jgi:hypothetical protein
MKKERVMYREPDHHTQIYSLLERLLVRMKRSRVNRFVVVLAECWELFLMAAVLIAIIVMLLISLSAAHPETTSPPSYQKPLSIVDNTSTKN